ncbi:MAG TPA: hypothetical protein ENI99_04950 [Sedimenticola sp.]|nr:hypothetical protein [Sedimenticola sp.]
MANQSNRALLLAKSEVRWSSTIQGLCGTEDITFCQEIRDLPDVDDLFLVGPFGRDKLRAIRRPGRTITHLCHGTVVGPRHATHFPVRSSPLTTPEQLALSLGKTLDEETRRWALAWRDGWPGLSVNGVRWDDALKVIETISDGACQNDLKERVLRLDDLSLLLAHESERGLLWWATRPDKEDYDKARSQCVPVEVPPMLVLHTKATSLDFKKESSRSAALGDLISLEYAGPAGRCDYFLSLMKEGDWRQSLTLRLSRGEHQLHFRAEAADSTRCKLTELISELFSVLLVSGRPLRNYSATFLLPFKYEDIGASLTDAEKVTTPEPEKAMETMLGNRVREESRFTGYTDEEKRSQALLYFAPNLQRQLFQIEGEKHGETIQPIRHYRLRNAPKEIKLNIGAVNKNNPALPGALVARVEEVSLFLHYDDHAILSLRVTLKDGAGDGAHPSWDRPDRETEVPCWWHDLFIGDAGSIRARQLECWLLFTKAARLIYPSFPQQQEEQKIFQLQLDGSSGLTEEQPLNMPLLDLIGRLIGVGRDDLKEALLKRLGSDRLFVNVAYALAGPPPSSALGKAALRRVFSLALYVDRTGDGFGSQDGYAYDKEFIESRFDSDAYLRWEGIGTLMGHTNYSNVYMGHGRHFREQIAPVDVPHIYGRLLLLALFYQDRLQGFEREILLDERTDTPLLKQYRQFSASRERFIRFTNNYWFHLPTEQVQGRELYDRMVEKLRLKESYELVKEEIERAEDHYRDKFTTLLTQTGLLLTVIGFALALLAMDSLHEIWQAPAGLIHSLHLLIRISLSFGLALNLGLLLLKPVKPDGLAVLGAVLGIGLIGLIITLMSVSLFLWSATSGALFLLALWGVVIWHLAGSVLLEDWRQP